MSSSGADKQAIDTSSLLAGLSSEYAVPFAALETFLEAQAERFEPEMRPLVRECLQHSGKKLRPLLVFLVYADGSAEMPQEVIQAGAIVELVHLATLVHDDILDNAELRHRAETMVSRYGAHVSVLLGDALFAHALELAADYPDGAVCRAVARATRQVCSGEIAQTFSRRDAVPSVDAYLRMIDLKTAELFKVSAQLGGWLQHFSPEQGAQVRAFAGHLGIAYQILDDTADIFAEELAMGKTLGTDLATGKFTLPVIYWLDGLPMAERSRVLHDLRSGCMEMDSVRERLLAEGIGEQVEARFRTELEEAAYALEQIPGGYRRERLRQLMDYLSTLWNKLGPHMLLQL